MNARTNYYRPNQDVQMPIIDMNMILIQSCIVNKRAKVKAEACVERSPNRWPKTRGVRQTATQPTFSTHADTSDHAKSTIIKALVISAIR